MNKLLPPGSIRWFWFGWLLGGFAWAVNGVVWSIYVLRIFRFSLASFVVYLTFFLAMGQLIAYFGYRGLKFLFAASFSGLAAATVVKCAAIIITAGAAEAVMIAILLFAGLICAGFAAGIAGEEIRQFIRRKTKPVTMDRAA